MMREKDFITNILSAASDQRDINVPDEECLGKLRNIIELVQYLPNLQNFTLSDVYEKFTRLITSHQLPDFFIVQLMLVKSSQSASFEPKFHDNYLAFLKKIGSDSLYDEIVLTTCVISKAILCPEILSHPRLNQPFSEVLLHVIKNLGGWLGKVVVSTGRFLLKTDIDLKSLIVDAYEQGLMTKIIPFVLEFLEPCRRSPLYQLSNPWTVTILRLLYEIYIMPNLQNSLRLSIEGLLEKFCVLKQLKPTSILQEKHRKAYPNGDFCSRIVVKPLKFGKYNKAPHDIHLVYSREKFSQEFLVTIKKSSVFFGIYPELERKMKDVVSFVMEKIGPLLIKLAATVACESAKSGVLMYYHHGRTDWSGTRASFHGSQKAGGLAKKYIQYSGKIFLCGWMSYLVGDLLQQHGVPYALQREIVEGVVEDNLECMCEKLGECAAAEANEYFWYQLTLCTPKNYENLVQEISNELKKDVDINAMSSFLETVSECKEEKLAALCEVICNQSNFRKDPPSVWMYTKEMAYIDPLVKGINRGEFNLMYALENFCKNSSLFSRGLEDLLVDGFLRTGYLTENVILEWLEECSTRDENNARLIEYVRPLSVKLTKLYDEFIDSI